MAFDSEVAAQVLGPFAARFMQNTSLTPAERAEVLRIARGFACKDSAAAANVSPETIRARRKRIYRKLDLSGAPDLIAKMLSLSLRMLARGERIESANAAAAATKPGSDSAAMHA